MFLMLCIYRVEFRFSDTLSEPRLHFGVTRRGGAAKSVVPCVPPEPRIQQYRYSPLA
ncbi:hypothetical protein CY34DRAFT_342279 [Suillus luteus UH-Slu-Lm8-n1]|uniref:Uncharacterized protein n=1 Tax=Suillus luteus UH-Slu-Lm8-n1 TaxID=930992 RepID=A0A0D0AY63_9AGAM|nr:hypothetical protein CY34DRAFT_342279 [Suillus luteus UH-Slu-Lm8-n1]